MSFMLWKYCVFFTYNENMDQERQRKKRTGGEDEERDSNWERGLCITEQGGGEKEKERDRNKQLKALWHVAQTAWRLFVVESWGLLPWWISGRPGGGCLPSLLTHNPLQTPLVLSNPLRLTTPLSERGEDLFISFLLSSSSCRCGASSSTY